MHPRSAHVPKVMLEIAGKSLLTRQLELVRDELGIKVVYLIVGHLQEQIPVRERQRRSSLDLCSSRPSRISKGELRLTP